MVRLGQIDNIIEDMTAATPVDIIPRPPVDALPWEKLSVALVDILGGMQQIVTVDELKRADAALGDSYHDYDRLAYFERVAQAMANLLHEKGVLSRNEVAARMDTIRRLWRRG